MDIHEKLPDRATAADVAKAHEADLANQGEYGANYKSYWLDENAGNGFDRCAVPEEVRRCSPATCAYGMVLWARWSCLAGLGARAIRAMHAEPLDQLRVPIDVMEAATGVTSDVFEVGGESAWLRRYE